jgi:hypothetical protein
MTRPLAIMAGMCAALIALVSQPALAQDEGADSSGDGGGERVLDVMRQQHDSVPLNVRVGYGGGELTMRPAPVGLLFAAHCVYGDDSDVPKISFDPGAHQLRIGGEGDGNVSIRLHTLSFKGSANNGDMQLELSPYVPLDLKLEFGAAEATLQLGGLAIRQLEVATGASSTMLRFDSPNQMAMQNLSLHLGAASFRATGLANARAREIEVNAGAGSADLDFGGRWTDDIRLDLSAAIGAIHVHVPTDVAVISDVRAVLGDVDSDVAHNPANAAHHLTIYGKATMGSIEVDRSVGGSD